MKPANLKQIGIVTATGAALVITGWVVTKPERVSARDRLMAGFHLVTCVHEIVPAEIKGCAMRKQFRYV